jgi:carbon starvation protein
MAVFIVSFAGTTLDSATRIQRFSLQELLKNRKGKTIKPFDNRYVATFVVVFAAAVLAFLKPGGGKGALILWPLFGALNQLLAGLALMIATVYLAKKKRPFYVTLIPMVFMLTMTIWATFYNLNKFIATQNWLLIFISVVTLLITAWMIYESAKAIANSKSQKPLVEELED